MTDAARGTTVTVGVVQGGTRSNVVPAEAAVEVDVRIASIEEAERITNAIKALSAGIAGRASGNSGSRSIGRRWNARPTPIACSMPRSSVAAQIGIDLKEGSTGGASDGNFTSALGIPTLDGLGRRSEMAHTL